MLRQMGVDVWLLRRETAEALAELSAPERLLPTAEPAQTEAAQRAPVAQPEPRPQPPVSGPEVQPFSVYCLSKGPVLMLVELGASKAERRFALDVLAASSGLFGGNAAQLAFEWPQPGVDNNPGTVRKALRAFVAKQLGDQQPEQILIGREVAGRLEQLPEGAIELAPLAELMVDGALKRALWAELAGH